MSTEVLDYPEDTEEAIGSKAKPAQESSGSSQVGSKMVRWSQQQLEKATVRRDKGDKDLSVSGDGVPIKVDVTVVGRECSLPCVIGFNEQEGKDDACPPSNIFSPSQAAEAAPSLPMPQDNPSTSASTLPSVPLFLPSSHPTTPTPTSNPQDPTPPPSHVDDDTFNISVAFVPVPSGILDKGNVGTNDSPANVKEINLTMP
ncbi:hypothetical protein BKA83DRAFT_4496633 [Pisolithus microcarpus]|nr:hypothetical protein BKA83DRAFT_4496633 [Pisolithus microcarpus]